MFFYVTIVVPARTPASPAIDTPAWPHDSIEGKCHLEGRRRGETLDYIPGGQEYILSHPTIGLRDLPVLSESCSTFSVKVLGGTMSLNWRLGS